MLPKLFPQSLWKRIQELYPNDIAEIEQGFSSVRKGSLRINTLRQNAQRVYDEFQHKNIPLFPSFHPDIWFFDAKNLFAIKGTDVFYAGDIYLQSISSLLPVLYMSFSDSSTVLDVCAAPGSKTSQMAAAMHNKGSIVALEKNKIRYDKLLYTIKTQGVTNVQAYKIDALDYLKKNPQKKFSHILLDAPCSAEGRISFLNEKTFRFWNEQTNKKNADLQKTLLSAALHHLPSGGELIYSTCTLSPQENEAVVSAVVSSASNISIIPFENGRVHIPEMRPGLLSFRGENYLDDCIHTIRVIPSLQTEGFFIARLFKK